MAQFELVVQDAAGLESAQRIAPDRIELCQALSTGGLTPSAALIARAVDAGLNVHVLIRPREGGFGYSPAELQTATDDARRALDLGAHGVVVGALKAGELDTDFVGGIVQLAEGADVTVHRAFDQVPDQLAALDTLIGLGVTRVLTSGGQPSAELASDRLRELVRRADGRIEVMAGAGVNSRNAAQIAQTGVAALHASAKTEAPDTLAVSLGAGAQASAATRPGIDENEARAIMAAIASSPT